MDKWSQDYEAEDIKSVVQCQELLGWRFLPLKGDGIIKNGRVVVVHYATYLPNLGLLDDKIPLGAKFNYVFLDDVEEPKHEVKENA